MALALYVAAGVSDEYVWFCVESKAQVQIKSSFVVTAVLAADMSQSSCLMLFI
jgi:hypothetical protein